jgi:hypothetical protein
MVFVSTIASAGSLPALHTYKCEECGVRRTETEKAREPNLYLVGPASSLLTSFGQLGDIRRDPARLIAGQ